MLFDIERFCRDQQIPTGPAGHKHVRPGWTAIMCPFCEGNFGYHLAYSHRDGYWTCYRCGWWPHDKVISAITGERSQRKLDALMRPYWENGRRIGAAEERPVHALTLSLPTDCGPLSDAHKRYLIGRNYDPDLLERRWGLMGTGRFGDYKFRVIAPIEFNHQLISYQGRDITGKQSLPYKACEEENEVIHHKHILYGYDRVPGDHCLVVEGITGVWRLGFGAVATFGAKVGLSQIRLLTKFKRIFLMFDPDPAGQEAVEKVSSALGRMGREVEIFDVPDGFDSGDVPQDEADRLMKEVLK